ncbi:MAG: GumC family protein [Roseiarcus sp.]
MFDYSASAERPSLQPASSPAPSASSLGPAVEIARNNAKLIVALGLAGAVAAYAASAMMTPKYVATAEIYVDPGSAQSVAAEPITPGEDSNGFVSYVESQGLIVASRSVMERVARDQGLERDPEFSNKARPSILPLFSRGADDAVDPVVATARVFATHVQVSRPERTFVLDISVSSRDPEKAAKLADATAQAYMEEVSDLRAESAKRTSTLIARKLEALRTNVIDAEQAIETYKAANGLVGAKDVTLVEQQLRNLDDQITAQRAKESDARSRAESAEAARAKGGDLGVFAAQFGLMTLSQLRGQQAEAKQKLADALADLGPRHPQAIEAEAQLDAANKAVDAELERFARSQRIEYQRAKATEADLQRQLDLLKDETHVDDQAMVGLRDLERKAQAARDIYELFVARSRDAGEIQEVAPIRTKVISAAAAPKARSFPPSGAALAAAGFVGGLALGFVIAFARESGALALVTRPPAAAPATATAATPEPPAPSAPEPLAPSAPHEPLEAPSAPAPLLRRRRPGGRKRFLVGEVSELVARPRRQQLERLDLAALGIRVLAPGADAREFADILDALPRAKAPSVTIITGANEAEERSSLALNLALEAARAGRRVALVDAAGRNARLTRAVRVATRMPVLTGGPAYQTANGALLLLPKAGEAGGGRIKPLQALEKLIADSGDAFDLIFTDGPDASEMGAADIFEIADDIVALDDPETRERLDDLGFAPTAEVSFAREVERLKRA